MNKKNSPRKYSDRHHQHNNSNNNKNKPSARFDYNTGDSSTISSAFSQSTGSTWSVPRNRTHYYYSHRKSATTSDGAAPRRNRGPGFRVSLRPSRHRSISSNSSTSSSLDDSVVELCSREDAVSWNRLGFVVIAIVLLIAAIHVDSKINYFSNFYDKITLSEDERMEKAAELVATQTLQEMAVKTNLRATDTTSTDADSAAKTIKSEENKQASQGILSSSNGRETNSRTTTDVGSNEQRRNDTQSEQVGTYPRQVNQAKPQSDNPLVQPWPETPTVTATKEQLASHGSFYENIYNNERAYDPEQVLEEHTALRMIENAPLATGNETYDEMDGITNPTKTNTSAPPPERNDWSPRYQPPHNPQNTTVVAYILPVYTCYKLSAQAVNSHGFNEPSSDKEFRDAALMLQASIHQNSIRNPQSNSSYDYEMVALVHRGIQSCHGGANRTTILQSLGYRVEVVREPIHQVNIADDYLRNHAPRNNGGRAGMREMIRLYAFKMVEYPIVVLVDTTTWVLHPPDAIYDTLLNGLHGHQWAESHPDHIVRDTFYPNGTITTSEQLPVELDIMFSRDYSTMQQGDWTTGISLAFLPIRPSIQTYRQLVETYQKTPYHETYGWDRKGYAKYAGSMQTKGLLTYFFSEIRPERKLELNRCIYNNLADVPYIAGSSRGGGDSCHDVKEHKMLPDGETPMPCTDCRIQEWEKIVVANFAVCQVPWVCPWIENPANIPLLIPTLALCRRYHEHWFALRKVMEEVAIDATKRTKARGTFHSDVFKGYCMPGGERGGAYVSMEPDIELPNGFGSTPIPLLNM